MESYQQLVDPSNLTFDDEFTTFVSSPNGSVGWMTSYDYGGISARALPNNGEAQYFSDSSVGVNPFSDQNGVLTITATVAPPGSNPYGLPYNSGMITSYKSLSQIYGYFEIDAKLPAGQGLWSAFYLLPTDVANQQSEIDVFEVLGNAPGTVNATVHWKVNGVAYAATAIVNVANTSTGFNTFGVDWEPTTTTVYMDGQVIASFATQPSMDQPMYMLAGLQVGSTNSWPGAPSSSAEFPATMQIQYVRAYATANTIDVSGTKAIETAAITGQLLLAGAGWAGATVSLLNAAGTIIATTTTNAAGTFSFANLAAGDYQVKYAAPAGTVLQTGSEANAATGLTPAITLGDGQTVTLPAEQLLYKPATIKATVLEFGLPGGSASGSAEAGVTVSLLNAAGTVIATAVSAANGRVTFSNVAPGSYQLDYTPPPGQAIEPGGLEDVGTGLTAQFTAAAGQTVTAPNGDLIIDTIAGAVTLGGAAQAGVTVSLLSTAGKVLATTTTSSAGVFRFGGLAAGSYAVKYTAPSGQVFQTGSEADAATGITPVVALAANQALILPTEQLLSNPATINSSVLHFGAPTDSPLGTGEGGVTVSLLNAAGAVIATTVSASSGGFSFGGLAAGTYQLDYTVPSGQTILPGGFADLATGLTAQFTVAAGQYVWAPNGNFVSNTVTGTVLLAGVGEAGVTVTLLTTDGTVIATTTSDSNGAYTFTGMAAGTYQVGYTPPSGQAIDPTGPESTVTGLTAPFAVTGGQTTAPSGALVATSIAGTVALAGAAEAGVTVSLLGAAGQVLATTATDSAGAFIFAGLAAGSYAVAYAAPSGQVFQTGSAASAATGITPIVTLAYDQALTLPTEQLLSNPGTISAVVDHYGAPTDNAWGTGMAGVTVSLLSAAGAVIATTVSNSWGAFSFGQIGPGTYQLDYTAPSGQGFLPGAPEDPATGLTASFTVGAGQAVSAPMGKLISTIVMNGTNLTQVAPAGGYLVTGNASNSTLTLGSGMQYVTLTGGGNSVTTGTGNQTITLSGNNNTVTLATSNATVTLTGTGNTVIDNGTSGTVTINAGSGNDSVHVTGGTDNITINATGSGNLFDAGPGLNFLNADGSSGNIFALNAAANPASSLTTITGFNTAGDILDLNRTLAGTSILPDLSNLGSLVTAAFSGANTILYAVPTGGRSPVAFAVLDGVHVTVAQLLAAGDFSLAPVTATAIVPISVTPSTEAVTSANGASVNPFSGVGITDSNIFAQSETATVSLSAAANGVLSDPNAATDGSTVAGGVLTITGTAAAVASALDGLVFTPQAGQTVPSLTTIVTAAIQDTAGQTAAAASTITASSPLPGTISSVVDHFGAPTDNAWGSGMGGVTVSLLNAAGAVIATTVSNSWGAFSFGQVASGTYQLDYTAPSGQGFLPGAPEDPSTGLTAPFTVAAGQTVSAPAGELISTIVMNGTNLTEVAPPGGYLVTGNASNSTLILGSGLQYVTLTGSGDSVTTGTGTDTISLSGNNNTVTLATSNATVTLTGTGNTVIDNGTSGTVTINAGSGNDTVHVTGGTDNITINATGSGNLFDAGPGLNFLNADGSSGNTFMLNAAANANVSLTTITGFNAVGDILDLKRTLAGTSILPDLSNVGSLVTASFSGANTYLWAAPAGGGSPLPFAVLDGVHVTVAQLLAAQEFSLS